MPAERTFSGQAASPGLAFGAIDLRILNSRAMAARGAPADEQRALQRAIDAAREQLTDLSGRSDDLGGEILTLQVALLEDPELSAPAFDAMARGASAVDAWRQALDAMIQTYQADESEYFRARATDLADLRDRVSDILCETDAIEAPGGQDAIYVAQDLAPSRFLETDWSRYLGAALMAGSATSHVAILARARGVPLVIGIGIGIGGGEGALRDGAEAILDAEAGQLILDPAQPTLARYRHRLTQRQAEAQEAARFLDGPAVTAGGASVRVCVNVDDLQAIEGVDPGHCDGVGLTRSEFLFHGAGGLPDEDRQYNAYARLIDWAAGRPVTIRTLDAGGDKPIPGFTPEDETNPFLGLRGLRLSLARPEVFRVQLRALARAAARGPLKVMFPMVTTPAELDQARALFEEELANLVAAGVAAEMPPLGIMIEVPAAALNIAQFEADFFSIGSNDLVQYVTATGRDNGAVAALHDPSNPAVLELIERVVDHGRKTGREVSLCGDMAAEPACLARLLELGLRSVSVAPAALARTKAEVARSSVEGDLPHGG